MKRKGNSRYLALDLNLESEDEDSHESFEKIHRSNSRGEACDDDREYTAPYIGLLPEESEHEHGSPLNFGF